MEVRPADNSERSTTETHAEFLRVWIDGIRRAPDHNAEFADNLEYILEKAEGMGGAARVRFLRTAAQVAGGLIECMDLYEESFPVRPALIDHLDMAQRGARSDHQAYKQIFGALGFRADSTTPRNDHGMRVVETVYVSPALIDTDGATRMVLVELWQRMDDVTLFAEIQPLSEA